MDGLTRQLSEARDLAQRTSAAAHDALDRAEAASHRADAAEARVVDAEGRARAGAASAGEASSLRSRLATAEAARDTAKRQLADVTAQLDDLRAVVAEQVAEEEREGWAHRREEAPPPPPPRHDPSRAEVEALRARGMGGRAVGSERRAVSGGREGERRRTRGRTRASLTQPDSCEEVPA